MGKVKPCDLPGRDNYEKMMLWALDVCISDEMDLAELQSRLQAEAKDVSKQKDDHKLIVAVLALLGFCAVIDRMAELSEANEGSKDGE